MLWSNFTVNLYKFICIAKFALQFSPPASVKLAQKLKSYPSFSPCEALLKHKLSQASCARVGYLQQSNDGARLDITKITSRQMHFDRSCSVILRSRLAATTTSAAVPAAAAPANLITPIMKFRHPECTRVTSRERVNLFIHKENISRAFTLAKRMVAAAAASATARCKFFIIILADAGRGTEKRIFYAQGILMTSLDAPAPVW